MAVPDDTGEGYIRSLFGSAVRGAGEVVPGAIEGLGALTGIEPLEKAGRAIRSGLEYIAPVNPVQEGVGTSLANVAGNVVSMIGTGGVGGLTGKALAAERIAAGATAAERAALASQAIGKGAQAAMYGTTGLQGAASGAQAADQYGMTGGQRYANILGHAASEILPEMIPAVRLAETGLARRLVGADNAVPGLRRSTVAEMGQEGLTQIGRAHV